MPARTGSTRLNGVDAAFLYLERKEIPLHIAAVSLFDGPIPYDRFVEHIKSRLHLLPRYRQVPVPAPLNLEYPSWEYDPHFSIRHHILKARLPAPGGEAELEALAGEVLGQVLDRRKPLWEIHVVEGLQDGRGALIARVHHSLADGIAGEALLKIMLDATPEGSPAPPKRRARRRLKAAAGNDSLSQTLAKTVRASLENLITVETGLLELAGALTSGQMNRTLEGLAGLLPELAMPVERLPFNRPCGVGRKFCWAEMEFADVQAIRAALGGTVNDVILTVVTRGLARYVKMHGETVAGRLVRMVCPVNIRCRQDQDLGNRITFLPVVLPLDVADPARNLQAVAARMEVMKGARAGHLVALLAGCLAIAPPPVQALMWSAISHTILPVPLFNMICTNVPGSPVPLYAVGRRMLTSYPHVPTGYDLGVGCAAQSYDGKLFFGLTADAQVAGDVASLRDFIRESFAELCRAAGVKQPAASAAAAGGGAPVS